MPLVKDGEFFCLSWSLEDKFLYKTVRRFIDGSFYGGKPKYWLEGLEIPGECKHKNRPMARHRENGKAIIYGVKCEKCGEEILE